MKKILIIPLVVVSLIVGGFINDIFFQPEEAIGAKEEPTEVDSKTKKDKIVIKDGKKYLEETTDETTTTEFDKAFYESEKRMYENELVYCNSRKAKLEDKLKETNRQLKLFK